MPQGLGLRIDFQSGALGDMLRRAAEGGRDLSEPLALSGDVMENSIRQRFRDGRGPGGIPWIPSNRARADAAPKKGVVGPQRGATLIKSGALSTGISSEVSGQSVTAGVQAGTKSAKYARTHQFGATIVPRVAKFLVFNIPGVGLVFAKKVTIPARPFVGIDAGDVEALTEVWTHYAQDLLS